MRCSQSGKRTRDLELQSVEFLAGSARGETLSRRQSAGMHSTDSVDAGVVRAYNDIATSCDDK